MKSHFFAYMARMKHITRWGLMRNTLPENIQEHSLQTAMIAQALAVIKNTYFDGHVDANQVLAMAVYHEAGEVITGDLATPIKYFNPEIKKAYKDIEDIACHKILSMLPKELQEAYKPLILQEHDEVHRLVKAADRICAYLKCLEERKAGNGEFAKAEEVILLSIQELQMPEVDYFMETFVPSFSLTLDELNEDNL